MPPLTTSIDHAIRPLEAVGHQNLGNDKKVTARTSVEATMIVRSGWEGRRWRKMSGTLSAE